MKKRSNSPRHKRLSFWFLILSLLLFVAVTIFVFFQNATKGEGVDIITSFLGGDSTLAQSEGWTNVLLLGRGGILNDTPDLTDSIVLAQISHTDKRIVLLSIPRDVWVPEDNVKINHLYLLGKEKGQLEAFSKAKHAVTTITGLPIHYAAVVDYSGFESIIDAVDGIDVTIENTFTDYKFPIIGKENDECNGDKTYACRYEIITFTQGTEHMDGARALKFVRSRHSLDNQEGTDLARAKRQQQVITAMRKKMTSPSVLTSYKTLISVRDAALASVNTDMTSGEAASLARLALDSRDDMKSIVLGDEFLMSPPLSRAYGGQFVYLPKTGNWDSVKKWVNEARALSQ